MTVNFSLALAWLRIPVIRRGVAVLLGLTVLLIATEIWVSGPVRQHHAQQKAGVIALQSDLAVINARLDAVSRYTQMEQVLDTLNTKLAAPIDRSDVVDLLARISSDTDTRIIHGANQFGKPRAEIVPVLQDLTVEGAYDDIRAFLDGLANLETLTLIRSVEFTSNPDGTLVRARLKLVTINAGAG